MRRLTRDTSMALGFAVFSFALAFWQRPSLATSDTKVDLHVDPASFLGEVVSAWSPSIDLGAVQSAQYTGFAWPMSAFYAALDWLGAGSWVSQRLWLGLLFALSAWGTLKLVDALVGRPRGAVHLVAAAFFVCNPYTVVFSGRTTATLVGYAALPWLLLIVLKGLRATRDSKGWRDWRPWWWAAAFALVLTSAGGGINGAVVGWMLVGPLLLLVYEPLSRSVRWRDSGGLAVRIGVLGGLTSAWWIVPLLIHARFGADFLQFTEQPNSIWAVNSAPETLRLMGYWTTYTGVGFSGPEQPLFSEAETLLFNPWVVWASLLLPALALLGFVASRRQRYATFLLLLLLVGALIEVAGFPNGTPARDAMEWVYRNFPLLRFMRTTQKAAPLVALGSAGLLGLGTRAALARLRELSGPLRRRAALIVVSAGLAVLIALAALPLTRGTAVDKQVTWDRIPPAWTQAGRDLDRSLAPNTRAMVLPGQIFAYYRWGSTVDNILPRLTERPVAVRFETSYADARATDVLWTVDRLVQQRRLVPGQLKPLLELTSTGAVVAGSDDYTRRSGAVEPAAAAEDLAAQGLAKPSRSYGPARPTGPPHGEPGPAPPLRQVRRFDLGGARGLVSVAPQRPPVIVDGGAEGLASMAAFGALPRERVIQYAGDLSDGQLRRDAAQGADFVITDSNRRRRFVPEYARQNLGETLTEKEELSERFASIEPFLERGPDAQTVSVLKGASYLKAPNDGGLLEFPEHSAAAAFDGDRSTSWSADRYLRPRERWIEVGFGRRRDVPWVDLEPIRDRFGVETQVDVNGVKARLGPGVTRVPTRLRGVSVLRMTITHVRQPPGDLRGSGGFREIRIPGVRVQQRLRPPVLVGRALAGHDLSHASLAYLLERTTADDPFRRERYPGSPLLELAQDRTDPERQLDRLVFTPQARRYSVEGWVHPAAEAPDSVLDRLAGVGGGERLESSGRFKAQPRYRASSAFDGRADTSWVGIWAPGYAPAPFLERRGGRAATVSRIRLVASSLAVRRPTRVRVTTDSDTTPALAVGPGGAVRLPRAVRTRLLRVTVEDAALPSNGRRRGRAARAVGVATLDVPGWRPVEVPRAGALRTRCGDSRVLVGGREVGLRPVGSVEGLDAGLPLRARGCGPSVPLAAGAQRVRSLPGDFSLDRLRLASPAPEGTGPVVGGGRVVNAGDQGTNRIEGAKLALDGPSWVVLGQSFSRAWRTTCDGRSLGEPEPVNGYANGWRAPAACRRVDFSFAPQKAARTGYAIAAIAGLVLAVFLIAGWLLSRGRPERGGPERELPDPEPHRMALPRAAGIALAATVPLALLFALRSGLVIFPLLTLILWRGWGNRALGLAAAGLVGLAVPLGYLISSPRDHGGYNFDYGQETIWAHWLGVVALVLLVVICWRTSSAARRATPV